MPWIYGDCYMHIYVSDVFNVTFDHSTLSHVISKECYNHRLQNEPKQNITMWKAKPQSIWHDELYIQSKQIKYLKGIF